MRLGAKILLTSSTIFIVFIAVLFFFSQRFILSSFKSFEERRTAMNAERVLSALEGELENLHTFNLDWASWDDTFSFILDRNSEYIRSTLNDETLAKQRLNLIAYFDGSGRAVYAKSLDLRSMDELPVPEGLDGLIAPGRLLLDSSPDSEKSGFISLDEGYMMVSARPITTSEGKGPARGTLIMGRYLEDDVVAQLSRKTHLPVSLMEYDGHFRSLTSQASRPIAGHDHITVMAASSERVRGYALVRDILGSPVFVLMVELPRDIYWQGRRNVAYFMAFLAAAALISMAVMLVFLKTNVISRLSRLIRSASEIGRTGNLSARVNVSGGDELTVLSSEINRMLGSLEVLEGTRRENETRIRAANDELERRVRERTAELVDKNIELGEEVAERKRVEEAMKQMVYHDYLTGLPNRMLFTDRLNQILSSRRRGGADTIAAVMFMDMDRFKVVNDSLGHAAGDELIKTVARLTQGPLRDGDTVARIGGDEFTILLRDIASVEDIPPVAERLLAALREPIDLMGNGLFVTVSIGIAVYPFDGEDSTTLMKNADIAMYHAKGKGGDTCEMYNAEMAERAMQKLTIGNKLRAALEAGEFVLYYQPQYDLRKRRFTGAEALIRWQDRELGLVSPVTFIPIAEETGIIVPVGEWVLRTACALNRKLNERGLNDLSIAINISPRMFAEPAFTATVVSALDESGLDPRYLNLEITEGLLMSNIVDAGRTIREMKSAGVRFSIDDFGTGYSSLAYLKALSINELKIDRSFIKDLTTHADDRLITKAIISLAHSLNLEVIAEGVETREQLDFLVEHHCDRIQGFYYSKPLPEEEFVKLLMEDGGSR